MLKAALVVSTAAVVACAGCSMRQADLTILSSRNVNLSGLPKARTGTEPRVEGRDVQHVLLFIPVTGPPNLEEALDRALDEGKGDVMMDAVVYSYWWYIPLLYGQAGWKVKGTVINSSAAAARN